MKTAPYKASQDRIEGEKYIAGMRNTVRALWLKACEFDHIPSHSSFVVFSAENKYEQFYQIAMKQYLDACREYEAGGYVGLRIV